MYPGSSGTQVYSPELGGMAAETEPVPPTGCGACLQENGTKSMVWKFVGEGQGSFSPLQSYEYVGQGRGTHEKEVVVTPGRFNLQKVVICIVLPICIALAALGIYWAMNVARGSVESGDSEVDFDCNTSPSTWSDEQKDWCCANAGTGCVDGQNAEAQACQTMCTFAGHTASCAFRVRWGSTHKFKTDPQACVSAYEMVSGQCPMCRACPLAATKCVPPR